MLATMNTADRNIAGMDLAVRRRFAFVAVPPERDVVARVQRATWQQAEEEPRISPLAESLCLSLSHI